MSIQDPGYKRQTKIAEWESRLRMLHQKYPRLEEIARLFSRLTLDLALAELGKGRTGMSREEMLGAMENLQSEKKAILRENKLPANIYDIWWDCEKCQDTGYITPGVKCSCRIKEEIAACWQMSGLSPLQKQQTFENFSLDWFADKERYRKILTTCLDFAEKVTGGRFAENLFLYGPVGTGKTHLSSAIANYVLTGGVAAVYMRISQMLDLIREYKFNQEDNMRNVARGALKDLYHVKLLILDDLGTEILTDFAHEQLLFLLDERINYRLPWVISTNLTPNEIKKKYDARLIDRILGTSYFLEFTGESIRQLKKARR